MAVVRRNCGRMYNYFCYGAGSSLVEVDCLTGDHHVLRSTHQHFSSSSL